MSEGVEVHRVAELVGATSATIAFDQPTLGSGLRAQGSGLRGLDKAFGNTETGLLFNLICLTGECANPAVLLEEIDKGGAGGTGDLDPLAQLHSALEPEASRRTVDMSADLIEFDASLVTYVATANRATHPRQPGAVWPLTESESFELIC